MRAGVLLLLAVSCGGPKPAESAPSPSPPISPSPPTSVPNPTSTSGSPASAAPTSGSVFIGDIAAAKKFDPKHTLDERKQALLDCYNQVRATKPRLSGKLTLLILVNEAGTVVKVDPQPGGSANTPELVSCIEEVLEGTPFPRPGGLATVVAPLLFRP